MRDASTSLDPFARMERWGRRMLSSGYERDTNSSNTRRSSRTPAGLRYPEALPCHDLYELYPDEVGPTANVIITDPEEVARLLLVARPVAAEEAAVMGGCLQCNNAAPDVTAETARYFCLTDPDDVVYGRAAYLPGRRGATGLCSQVMGGTRCDVLNGKEDFGDRASTQSLSESCTSTQSF